ncbi:deoxyribodipyrimidine photo-lyase [Ruegeria halocynthiae]|uniref:Deoxyribodipyrimidine photo-lyase n=1 Tax=Ruegeria halocynthiae TaxID=985054 RepID=A0A1H2TYZ0_9RHOB|nr:deoxyribodipyrimidine photo-lyase [Ruegeria halocynthiae]SDW48978.1 deoxyribodipyrimidine photo-lyase [Ruegeria halocynthiae]
MKSGQSPIILWFRRDLRLSDHPALAAAVRSRRPIVPVFILDDQVQSLGAAPKWRLGLGLKAFAQSLEQTGSRLILRQGDALDVLCDLIEETGAGAVFWSRAYDPDAINRDKRIKAILAGQGTEVRSFAGHLLFEPWTIATKAGQPFRVFTPMWRSVHGRDVPSPELAPARLTAPQTWPATDQLVDWRLDQNMRRGACVVQPFVRPGEAAALDQLDGFLERIDKYREQRDRLDDVGTSDLSEYLALGEIGPRAIWHRVQNAGWTGASGSETYLRQLVWREFAYHLMYHWPDLLTNNWKSEWDAFPWNTDPDVPEVWAWRRARTGVPVVDAGLRQMYVTGRMHNRARMIVASYLTKHLMTHWKIGADWFADCLTDWDPAANAMGWQWVAGSGPDAAPYFRIFNPMTQRERFDPNSEYLHRWVAEGCTDPSATALAYFDAAPRSWGLSREDLYPDPVVNLREGRARALHHYKTRKDQ